MSAPLAYDGSYLRSTSGLLNICCLLASLIGGLCVVCSAVPLHNFRGSFYVSVAAFGFFATACVLVARLLQVWQRKFYNFEALKFESHLNGFLACAYFVASAVALSLDVVAYSMATFFGFLAFSFYAYDAYLGYRLRHRSDAATQTLNVFVV